MIYPSSPCYVMKRIKGVIPAKAGIQPVNTEFRVKPGMTTEVK